mmetsp:Transcript_3036/g.7256  ORF Transcript_3036/g.7256 Transcript_3036/m.7256 type:complete len:269 (+) Transcript_3036:241-1047(+)
MFLDLSPLVVPLMTKGSPRATGDRLPRSHWRALERVPGCPGGWGRTAARGACDQPGNLEKGLEKGSESPGATATSQASAAPRHAPARTAPTPPSSPLRSPSGRPPLRSAPVAAEAACLQPDFPSSPIGCSSWCLARWFPWGCARGPALPPSEHSALFVLVSPAKLTQRGTHLCLPTHRPPLQQLGPQAASEKTASSSPAQLAPLPLVLARARRPTQVEKQRPSPSLQLNWSLAAVRQPALDRGSRQRRRLQRPQGLQWLAVARQPAPD